jgi:hypothetical protein
VVALFEVRLIFVVLLGLTEEQYPVSLLLVYRLVELLIPRLPQAHSRW